MIKEAKDILAAAVSQRALGMRIVRSMAEESHAIMARQWPLVSLITNPGRFDDREAKTVRYPDGEAGIWKERYVRGKRILPVLLRCLAEGEDATDALFSRILPGIPRKWEYDGFEGSIVINGEEHTDATDNLNSLYLSIAEIEFSIQVAREEEEVPTINTVETEPEIKQLGTVKQ
jgi:hypothetical protein